MAHMFSQDIPPFHFVRSGSRSKGKELSRHSSVLFFSQTTVARGCGGFLVFFFCVLFGWK